ncbi:hypothetical protein DPMN_194311, partial [Dreissena polymorpha]
YTCRYNARLLDGDDYWVNGNHEREYNWGGATTTGMCACGQLGFCVNKTMNCNCDGRQTTGLDEGKVIDKSKLPILGVRANPGTMGIGRVTMGSVMYIPRNCHDAKFNIQNKVNKDGPLVLDFDGPDGALHPVLAHCDMTSYKHVGVTVVPHNRPFPQSPTTNTSVLLDYVIGVDALKFLVNTSFFCSQEAAYECTNSRLLNNGNKRGWFSDVAGNQKNYWPGGLGETNKCACAITGTCQSDNYGCNCDVMDGVTRKDFGKVINKSDLPIGSVTFLDIGGTSIGKYSVGPVMCAHKEFGIQATCQDYLKAGYQDSHTFLVDPDGPANPNTLGNLPHFPVFCEFIGTPAYAVTVLYHQYKTEVSITSATGLAFLYRKVTREQMAALVKRSVSCSQTVRYTCTNAPIHASNGKSLVTWTTLAGLRREYFAGNGSKASACTCSLTNPSTCTGSGLCECDVADAVSRLDEGLLFNKIDLPVITMNFTGIGGISSQAGLTLGPLKCRELFPNCNDLKLKPSLAHEFPQKDGFYTIDPDGEQGVEPFVVQCTGTDTTINVITDPSTPIYGDKDSPVSRCYQVKYMSNGVPVSPQQVQALVAHSQFCAQKLYQECTNAPISGSAGKDTCACGVTGSCAGGPNASCNCDLEDGKTRQDGGWIVTSDRLAVCEVCVSLDPMSSLSITPQIRRVRPVVSDLNCGITQKGVGKTCQGWRNGGETGTITPIIDIDGNNNLPPVPVRCILQDYPPFGWMEIVPKTPVIPVPQNGTDVKIEYYVYEVEMVRNLIEESRYCTQEVYLECRDAGLTLAGAFGWYSWGGRVQASWAGNNNGTPGCAGGVCQCNFEGLRTDGGVITDDSLLPVSRVVLGPSTGSRTLRIGPVKCYDLYRDCDEIKRNSPKPIPNPMKNNTYAIDPDQMGRNEPFAVLCDFITDTSIGITTVQIVSPKNTSVSGRVVPGGYVIPLVYNGATYDQVHALSVISGYCFQRVQYICYESPLIDGNTPAKSYYMTHGGAASSSWGVAGHPDLQGCACVATHTCPPGRTCHCDEKGTMTVDYGIETNRAALPILELRFGGQTNLSSANFEVKDVRCGPKTFGLPKDCEEAYQMGYRSGEQLIAPSPTVPPFLVYCDMQRRGVTNVNIGVTVIGHDKEEGAVVTFNETVRVKYWETEYKQVQELIKVSKYCFQPFRYQCRNTKLLSGDGYFNWLGGMKLEAYTGAGRSFAQECNCGRDKLCGGSEPRATLVTIVRPCNCDANDGELRADAGVFNSTALLPVKELTFRNPGTVGAYGHLVLGKLYCSDTDFDFNECETVFHDCHEHARCINTHGSYECQCLPGWKGLGIPEVWANGRNCYDDDECAMNLCPWSSTCTNLLGTFECKCKQGFRQIKPTQCEDIDECKENIDKCDENALCINLVGSYACRCKRNFQGNGLKCEPVGQCSCFGDPHCLTYDTRLIDYQGTCQYTISRDTCADLSGKPTFEVLGTFQRRDVIAAIANASWVKEVTFNVYDYSIRLMQGNEVRVNGLQVNMPYKRADIYIMKFGKFVEVYTQMGVSVTWDGASSVNAFTPGQYKGSTCGLCGNYNGDPADDAVVGPHCPLDYGEVTTNFRRFGDSWVSSTYLSAHPECAANCDPPEEPPICTGTNLTRATYACDKIFDEEGMFKECISHMDNHILKSYYHACRYDMCRVDGDTQIVLCEYAEMLVDSCIKDYGVNVTKFRRDGFCEMTCGPNMTYKMCGESRDRDMLRIPGYLMDGNKCVPPQECGCYYKQTYYSIGQVLTSTGCGAHAVCGNGGEMSETNKNCTAHAVCELRDGRYGCHCETGYIGDGVEICIKDPCVSNPCGFNETCLINLKESTGYKCLCSMGFGGDCGNCSDINECTTRTDNCPQNSNCVNTVGSFRCECANGYIMSGGQCEDVNECDFEERVCGNNTACSNKIGGYECPCCAGYERDQVGNCIVSTSAPLAGAPVCCVCDTDICNKPGQVCGEDGKTYSSIRDLVISNCEKGLSSDRTLTVDYFSRCMGSCGLVTCPKYQKCVVSEATGKPTCVCEGCSAVEAQSTTKVCTNELNIYPNPCVFKQIQCHMDWQETPLPDITPCEAGNGASPVGPWSGWSECSVTCGKGESSRTRTAFVANSTQPTVQVTECYEDPCPDGPCATFDCKNAAAECVVNSTGHPECECPPCTNIGVEEVCAYVTGITGAVRPGSWKSACHVQQFACENSLPDFEVMHKGVCGLDVVNCTRVPSMQVIRSSSHPDFQSERAMAVFACEGACGRDKALCCQPSQFESQKVILKNSAGYFTEEEIHVIKKCECVEKVTTKL